MRPLGGCVSPRQAGRAGRQAGKRAKRAGQTRPRPARRWHNTSSAQSTMWPLWPDSFPGRKGEGPSRVKCSPSAWPIWSRGPCIGRPIQYPPTHQSVRVLTGSWLGRIWRGHIRSGGERGPSLPWRSLDVEAQLTRPAHTLPRKRVQKSACSRGTLAVWCMQIPKLPGRL